MSQYRICKECGNSFKRAAKGKHIFCSRECGIKNWHKENKEHVKDYLKSKASTKNKQRNKKYAKDKVYREKVKANVREYNRTHPNKKREQHLKEYGLTIDEYNKIMELQNNSCAICKEPFINSKHTHVDHDHNKNTVRGILCGSCNLGLGKFYDSPVYLLSAIEYLRRYE